MRGAGPLLAAQLEKNKRGDRVRMQKEPTLHRGAVHELMTTFGIVKSNRMQE